MSKPPKTTPHSDIDGVHRDERRNTDVAAERGESADTVERAKSDAKARPPKPDEEPSHDDRSR